MRKKIIYILVFILMVIGIITVVNISRNKANKVNIEQVSEERYYLLKQEDKYGVINQKGEILIKPAYDRVVIPNPSKDIFVCYTGDSTKVFDENYEELFTKYENVEAISLKNIETKFNCEKSALTFKKDGKYGLINLDGKQILPANYTKIEGLSNKEGELLVTQDKKVGVVNINGKKLVPCQFASIRIDDYYTPENEYKDAGFITCNKTDEGLRYGYYNSNGEKIVDAKYNNIERINSLDTKNVFIKFYSNGQYGILKNKNILLADKYQEINYYDGVDSFIVKQNGKYGVIDLKGKTILDIENDEISTSEQYYYVTKNGTKEVYDKLGGLTNIDPSYMYLSTKNPNYFIQINLNQGNGYCIVNDKKEQITDNYQYISYLNEDNFIVANANSKLGIIDANENEKIKLENSSVQKVEGSKLISVIQDDSNKIAIYNSKLELIKDNLSSAYQIENNIFTTLSDEKERIYIDLKSEKLITNKEVYPQNNIYSIKQEDKFGFVDKSGNVIIEPEYDEVTEVNEFGYASVKKDGKWGSIDSNGKVVIEPTYSIEGQLIKFIDKYYMEANSVGNTVFTDYIYEE